jgi:Zn-dependent protease
MSGVIRFIKYLLSLVVYLYKNLRLHNSWVIVFPLLLWSFEQALERSTGISQSSALLWGLCGSFFFIISLLLHETGHIVSSTFFHIDLQKSFLFLFGSVQINDFFNKPSIPKILVALSGPLTSCIVTIFWYLLSTLNSLPPQLIVQLNYLVILNLLLVLVNLLPFYPLDMGVVFRFFSSKLKNSIDELVFPIGSFFLSCIFIMGIYSVSIGYFYNGIWWILSSYSFKMALKVANQKQYLLKEMSGEKVGDFMRENPVTVHPSLSLAKFMTEYYYRFHENIYPVVQYSCAQGVLTNQNIQKIPNNLWKNYTVGEIADPLSVDNTTTKDTDIVDILKKLTNRPDHNLLVIKNETIVGVLTLDDLHPYFSLKIKFPKASARYYQRKEKPPAERKSAPERVHFFPDKS